MIKFKMHKLNATLPFSPGILFLLLLREQLCTKAWGGGWGEHFQRFIPIFCNLFTSAVTFQQSQSTELFFNFKFNVVICMYGKTPWPCTIFFFFFFDFFCCCCQLLICFNLNTTCKKIFFFFFNDTKEKRAQRAAMTPVYCKLVQFLSPPQPHPPAPPFSLLLCRRLQVHSSFCLSTRWHSCFRVNNTQRNPTCTRFKDSFPPGRSERKKTLLDDFIAFCRTLGAGGSTFQ